MVLSIRQFTVAVAVAVAVVAVTVVVVVMMRTSGNGANGAADDGAAYVDPHALFNRSCADASVSEFAARLGSDLIATRTSDADFATRNAYWLTGDAGADQRALGAVRVHACDRKVPVVVVRMRPRDGLTVAHRLSDYDHYKPRPALRTWGDYDKLLVEYLPALAPIPAIVVLEPDLVMFALGAPQDDQDRQANLQYLGEFLLRVARICKMLPKAWVYVDIGNVIALKDNFKSLPRIATALLRVNGLRGFVINTMSFVPNDLNEYWARQLFCRTGLHYVIDTGRNGGAFSRLPTEEMQQCQFDPPDIAVGLQPGWAWGSQEDVTTRSKRKKRWEFEERPQQQQHPQQHQQHTPQQSSQQLSADMQNMQDLIVGEHRAGERMKAHMSGVQYRECIVAKSTNRAQDASLWLKTPGESDGRLYAYGEYHSCLLGHAVGCTGDCRMIVDTLRRPAACTCEQQQTHTPP